MTSRTLTKKLTLVNSHSKLYDEMIYRPSVSTLRLNDEAQFCIQTLGVGRLDLPRVIFDATLDFTVTNKSTTLGSTDFITVPCIFALLNKFHVYINNSLVFEMGKPDNYLLPIFYENLDKMSSTKQELDHRIVVETGRHMKIDDNGGGAYQNFKIFGGVSATMSNSLGTMLPNLFEQIYPDHVHSLRIELRLAAATDIEEKMPYNSTNGIYDDFEISDLSLRFKYHSYSQLPSIPKEISVTTPKWSTKTYLKPFATDTKFTINLERDFSLQKLCRLVRIYIMDPLNADRGAQFGLVHSLLKSIKLLRDGVQVMHLKTNEECGRKYSLDFEKLFGHLPAMHCKDFLSYVWTPYTFSLMEVQDHLFPNNKSHLHNSVVGGINTKARSLELVIEVQSALTQHNLIVQLESDKFFKLGCGGDIKILEY